MRDLVEQIQAALEQVLATGFVLPIHVAAVGSNGAGCLLTYQPCDDGLMPEFHYLHQGEMIAPVNMMLVDSRGEAARVVFRAGVDPQLLIN